MDEAQLMPQKDTPELRPGPLFWINYLPIINEATYELEWSILSNYIKLVVFPFLTTAFDKGECPSEHLSLLIFKE